MLNIFQMPKRQDSAGSTALGSLLQFCGQACSNFPELAKKNSRSNLPEMFGSWMLFFNEADLPSAALKKLCLETQLFVQKGEALQAATKEFHVLFSNPEPPVNLWESLWLSEEKHLFTEHTSKVLSWYKRWNAEFPSDFNEAADFIGYEICFAGGLFDVAHGMGALQDELEQQAAHQAFLAFLQEHVLLWIPDCLTQLCSASNSPFWKNLFITTSLTLDALRTELEFFD